MLKKIALASLLVVSASLGIAGTVAAQSGGTTKVKPAGVQPAPQGICLPGYRC
jgi:hypothetical protein